MAAVFCTVVHLGEPEKPHCRPNGGDHRHQHHELRRRSAGAIPAYSTIPGRRPPVRTWRLRHVASAGAGGIRTRAAPSGGYASGGPEPEQDDLLVFLAFRAAGASRW